MNILLTCAGRRNYLVNYFKEVLKGRGLVVAADMSAAAPAMQEADHAVCVPSIYSDDYIPSLLEVCKSLQIDAVISLNDLELPILAIHADKFRRNGVLVIVSDYSVVDICFDKWKTYQFLSDRGIATPRTWLDLDEAINAIHCGDLALPVVIKPRWGSASIGVEMAETLDELRLLYEVVRLKVGRSILAPASSRARGAEVIIQERLDGEEYGVDIVNDLEGEFYGAFAKRKLGMRAGETDRAISVMDRELSAVAESVARSLRHIGNLDCDFFRSRNRIYVLEMNARFGGGYPFTHEAGANVCGLIVSWLSQEEPCHSYVNFREGLMYAKADRMIRIDI